MIRVFLISILELLLLLTIAQGATLHVFPDGSGLYPTIQNAIDAAQPLDTVLLYPGTFKGEGNRRMDFGGKDLVLRGNGAKEQIVLDCEFEDLGVYLHTGESSNSVLEGFTVAHGKNLPGYNGGGIVCESSTPILRNLILKDNSGAYSSGLLLDHASVVVESTVFEGNEAQVNAGAVGIYWSSPQFRDVHFIDNTAYYQGGAVYCGTESGGEFVSCVFIGSTASQEGGALLVGSWCSTVFRDCQFIDNSGKYGGAVYYGQGSSQFFDCVFMGNSAELRGGAIRFDYPPLEDSPLISSCLFYGNSSGAIGGAIMTGGGATPIISGCTILASLGSGNGASGIASTTSSSPVVENTIIAFNQGPGIYLGQAGASLEIYCSDVYGNEGGNYTGELGDQTGLNGNISENPLFCDYENWILTLAEQSPCLPENNDCGVLMGALGMDCTLTAVEDLPASRMQLLPCFPNPFNPVTTVSLQLQEAAEVDLAICDVAGRRVKGLHNGWLSAGYHDLMWRGRDDAGRDVPSGIYFVVLDSPAGHSSRKITLLR